MTRMNATEHATTPEVIELLPPADYLCGITGAIWGETKNGKRYLELTVMTVDGHVMNDRVFGTEDTGKGIWVQRVIAKLAVECAASFTPMPDVPAQPHEDMDWERDLDVQAALLGGVIWLPIEVELGTERPDGTRYASRNKGKWALSSAAPEVDKSQYRKSAAWSRAAARVKDMRTTALASWKADMLAARKPAPVIAPAATAPADDVFSDDVIPF
jgi:hypothetical protein